MRRICFLFGFLLTTNMLLAQDVWTLKEIDLEMIKCPAGDFMMGSPLKELGRNIKEIPHKVILSDSFMIGSVIPPDLRIRSAVYAIQGYFGRIKLIMF